jgi:hypothetical protein
MVTGRPLRAVNAGSVREPIGDQIAGAGPFTLNNFEISVQQRVARGVGLSYPHYLLDLETRRIFHLVDNLFSSEDILSSDCPMSLK